MTNKNTFIIIFKIHLSNLKFWKCFSVCRINYANSVFIEKIHIILDRFSTKIFQIKYQNILDQVLKYIGLHTKIFQIVHENILDCIPKYFNKTYGVRKHFLIMIKITI